MTGAQLLVETLKAHGVDTIFGIPGIHNLAIYDALVDERAIRVVTTRDERGAGHMADGYARATGRPGVCLTVPGPGVTNALTAIAEAYADSSPVLLLASQLPSATVTVDREDFHQLRDVEAVLGVRHAVGRPAGETRGHRSSREGGVPPLRDGPTPALLCGSADGSARREGGGHAPQPARRRREANARVECLPAWRRAPRGRGAHGGQPAAAVAGWRRLEGFRCAAGVGRAAFASGGHDELRQRHRRRGSSALARRWVDGAPARTRGPGAGRHDPGDWRAFRAAHDQLVDAQDQRPDRSRGHRPHRDRQTYPGEHRDRRGRDYKWRRRSWPSVASGISAPGVRGWMSSRVREGRRAAIRKRAPDAVGTLEGLRRVLPDESLVFNDINGIACWGAGAFICRRPRTFHYPIGFGCLGFALPAAIGAKLARPAVPVVALCGDGGFLFSGHELATAVHERVSVIAVVFNDNCLRHDQGRPRLSLPGPIHWGRPAES